MAAHAQQQLRDCQKQIAADGLMIKTRATTKPHPLLAVCEPLANRIQKALQGAGLRSRDGQRPSQAVTQTATTPETATGDAAVFFEQYLKDLAK